jgi:2'-5' RNA ligase
MFMSEIWIVSLLEGEPYRSVGNLWRLFENKYNSVGVQIFSHPHITFQGGKAENPRRLKKDFLKVVSQIKPFGIKISGTRHFDKKAICLKVEKTKELIEINKQVNRFLETYCQSLLEHYAPGIWTPHITLAMDDLTEENFEKAWTKLKNSRIEFKQKLHNICMVKRFLNGKVKIDKRYQL